MTAILDITPTAIPADPAPAAAPAVCHLQATDGCPMNGGGEWCPTDQKLIDKCPAC